MVKDKEMEKMKKLAEEFGKIVRKGIERNEKEFNKAFKEANEEDFNITISRENGDTHLGMTGPRLTLLIGLVGATKAILEKTECSPEEYEFLLDHIGSATEDK